MPAIKKRITAEYKEREQQRNEQNGRSSADGEVDRENSPPAAPPPPAAVDASPLKRKAPGPPAMLKGLDGEVLVEKRKRTLPPAEMKLDTWLDSNFEKKAESTLSLVKMYQFYTDMCQQGALPVVEIDVFKTMLHNKFGKEFGLQESSPYNGLVKETKPRKKPVVAPSLGYKLKDLIEEALKASGNPSKGMMFAWVKKYLSAKYPALQIECRPHFLRTALEREIYAGRVELVKGIGFCGFYRQPGPPAVEEESKPKKKSGKKTKKEEKGDETADSADDAPIDNDKEEDKPKEDTDMTSDEKTADDQKKPEKDDSGEGTEEGKEGEGEDKKKEKKPKKKRKKAPAKRKVHKGAKHSNPQSLNDIFPLAMTYMAEPKEASFGRIRKYLEKYYGKTDIDTKLKKCMDKGIETAMWDRVSGSGASGSFQLLVDSFNPDHTESMTDMVCSAIIACTEPKTSSVRLLKSYISEYHPEFNIDTRPHKLKSALERAEKQNQLRRVSGIGMTGSFQLVDQFTPSPAILAGDEDDDESDYDVEEPRSKERMEVYVVRKTKSGRKAPLEKTQLDFSSTYKRAPPGSGAKGKKKGGARKASKSSRYAEGYSEEESSSEEEEDNEEEEAYRPRASKSRGGSSASASRNKQAKAAKSKGAPKSKKQGGSASKAQSTPKRGGKASKPAGKSPRKTPVKEEVESDVEDERPSKARSPAKRSTPAAKSARRPPARDISSDDDKREQVSPSKSGRRTNGSTSVKKSPAKKRVRSPAEESDNEEDYYEVEDESASPSRSRKPAAQKKKAASSPAKSSKRGAVESPVSSEGRTPRSAFQASRKSYKEDESDEESEEEYMARPSSSRSPKKR